MSRVKGWPEVISSRFTDRYRLQRDRKIGVSALLCILTFFTFLSLAKHGVCTGELSAAMQ